MLPEQRAYIHAWVDGVVRGGYRAGIYCSGIPFRESSVVSIVTANDIRSTPAVARSISSSATISAGRLRDACFPTPRPNRRKVE